MAGCTEDEEYDIGQLMLQRDGFNVGVALDGFTTGLVITKTVTGTNQAAGLLAALQADDHWGKKETSASSGRRGQLGKRIIYSPPDGSYTIFLLQ